MKKGFTIIELLVVIATLMILAGAVGVGVSTAQKNARRAKATATVRELTNAILAYEHASKDHKLPTMAGVDVEESKLAFLLGGERGMGTKSLQVLFNADMRGGKLYDPWGKPYKILIKETGTKVEDDAVSSINTTTFMPNFYRLNADEEEVYK